MHNNSIVMYKRTKKGAEKRLHNLLSIGIGGHISISDIILNNDGIISQKSTIEKAQAREIDEEIEYPEIIEKKLLGLIYDNTDEVSRVHIGIGTLWYLEKPFVKIKETELTECNFCHLKDLISYVDRMENWSRICSSFLISKFLK